MSFAFWVASEVHTRTSRPPDPPTPPSSTASHPLAESRDAHSWGVDKLASIARPSDSFANSVVARLFSSVI